MDLGYAVIKGVIQGLTEFLPVSSTAHLAFLDAFDKLYHFQSQRTSPQEDEFFNILVQVGTLAGVVYFFRIELLQMVRVILKKPVSLHQATLESETLPLTKLPWLLMLSTFCTCLFALVVLKGSKPIVSAMGLNAFGITDISDMIFAFPQAVAGHLIFTGILLVWGQKVAEAKIKHQANYPETVSIRHAVMIGIFQGCSAIFHGLSRSGSTISAGLMSGLDRVTATRYSFLLSIPAFLVATAYDALKFSQTGHLEQFDWLPILAGMLVAAVVGYYCVKAFVSYVAKHPLSGFAVYCWLVGGFMFFYFMLNPVPLAVH